MTNRRDGKLGIALVGLGKYSTDQLAPALQQTKHCYLAGIVTGTPSKIPIWKEKYNIPDENIYSYHNYDSIKYNQDIDIIYVVLPNSLHAEYSIKAAEAGKHVICEKPMAVSVEECDRMIKTCRKVNKHLSIGYRLHFDPYHEAVINLCRQKEIGSIKKISASFSFVENEGAWRLNKKYSGGGPLMDVGIYCLQAAMYITGTEPVAITAQSLPVINKEKFIDIEESLEFKLEMPEGIIAECKTSYSENKNYLKVEGENEWIELKPAFNYSGLKGVTSNVKIIDFPVVSQQAKQMDSIALSIKENGESIVSGEMGRRDMRLIAAIYKAMNTGQRIEL